jgi:hypothetical protein
MLVTLPANSTAGFSSVTLGFPPRSSHVKVNSAFFSFLVLEEWGSRKFAEVDALLSSVGPNRQRGGNEANEEP